MTESDVVSIMRAHLDGLFPKKCENCHVTYPDLKTYLQQTEQVGPAHPYDVEMGDWQPRKPIGVMTYANCKCGNTLVLTSEGMPLGQLWRLLFWARMETIKRDTTPVDLLNHLRDKISRQVLQDGEEEASVGSSKGTPSGSVK